MVWFVELSPSLFVFLGLSFSGILIVLLSSSMVGIWFGLECNFFGFIPLLNGKTIEESESSMKYFIIQGIGSAFIFMGVCLALSEFEGGLPEIMSGVLFVLGLMLKVGLFPFHFWFPSVMGSSSLFNCFMLSSWQKFSVFYVLSGLAVVSSGVVFFLSSAAITSLIGAVGGVGQVYFRPIMAYSSLVHSGWMMVVCLINEFCFMTYFLVYMSIVFYLFRTAGYFQFKTFSALPSGSFLSSEKAWVWMILGLLSLGGLPPMLGASIKLLGILVCFPVMGWSMVFLILSSVVGLFYYLSIIFSSSLWSSNLGVLNTANSGYSHSMVKGVFPFLVLNSVLGVFVFLSVGGYIFL